MRKVQYLKYLISLNLDYKGKSRHLDFYEKTTISTKTAYQKEPGLLVLFFD